MTRHIHSSRSPRLPLMAWTAARGLRRRAISLGRTSCASILLALASCGGTATEQVAEQPPGDTASSEAATRENGERIACAPNNASQMERTCMVERSQTSEGAVLTVRHADGGFRRLLVVEDGRGLVAADGAQPAEVTLVSDDEIEVTIGPDRYRLPATRKAPAS